MNNFYYPLMEENVTREDVDCVIDFLKQDPLPKFTNGPKVKEFEEEWGEWQGTPHNTMVGSGSVANEISLLAVKELSEGRDEVIVPTIAWVSDVAAILQAGLKPVFCDINLRNFALDFDDLRKKITDKTAAVILVHVLGLNGISDDLVNLCRENGILLIEDVAESHGTTFKGQKVGTFGDINNFSFFYAHHLCSLAEGGMVGTKNEDVHNLIRALRSHGMAREIPCEIYRNNVKGNNPDLNPDFIFLAASHNSRSQEVNAVVALNQLKRLDANNLKRTDNFNYFISKLDGNKYLTDLEMEGNCNYAFTVVLKEFSRENWGKVDKALKGHRIEFRTGLSGGGSQVRQPYLKTWGYNFNPKDFPNTEHVHFCGAYIGNYPTLQKEKIDNLLRILNSIDF